ncbi:BrnT family toxin [Candidatus Electronema sp. PJ]|uniref:BrnT family toxin n=1 Tax=Candidatus Electronema sp. PJ TaxID=3401572 RepID=UPI003AA83580
MELSFDPEKNETNIRELGLSFTMVENFDWNSAVIVEDVREDYGERRYQTLGFVDGHLHMVVFTPRNGKIHVISFRRANKKRERKKYGEQTKS